MEKFLVLDTETTGLHPDFDELLQLAILNQDGNILFHEFFRPENISCWPDAEAIHNISPADVANARPYKEYKKEIRRILSSAPLIVGYNLPFDLEFLSVELPFSSNTFDVMIAFAAVYGVRRGRSGFAWQSLSTCAAYYGYTYQAHDALSDAKATLHCYKKLKGIK